MKSGDLDQGHIKALQDISHQEKELPTSELIEHSTINHWHLLSGLEIGMIIRSK